MKSLNDIADRVAASEMSPTKVLVRHYAHLARCSRTAGQSRQAEEYQEACRIVAGVAPSFFTELAEATGHEIANIIQLFKDSRIVKFFQKIGWSFSNLWQLLRKGFKAVQDLQNVVADYVASTKVMRWNVEELDKLDNYLAKHPVTKRIAGVLLGAMLLYLFFIMASTGDPTWDFDLSDVLAALSGAYVLTDIFGGRDGAKLLMAVVAGGLLGLSFPWPVAASGEFAIAITHTLAKKVRKRI